MIKQFSRVLTLAAVGSLGCFGSVAAVSKPQTDYEFVVQATEESEQEYEQLKKRLLGRYTSIINKMQSSETNYVSIFSDDQFIESGSIPAGYSPWWQKKVSGQINTAVPSISTDVSSLFNQALQYSSQIKVFGDLPLIRKTTIQEAEGVYDFRLFAEGRLNDLDEPVGDNLQTGGPNRYREHSKSLEYGIRKRFLLGTEIELKQSIGDMDTNSAHFNPTNQARTGTHLTITQPFLKGFGISYNRTPIDLAGIDFSISREELRRNVESHLLQISRAYWGLYLERSFLIQKERLSKKTRKIYNQMKQRTGMDVPPSLLARAKSQVNAYELAAMQAEYGMLNAQSRIMALVNAPELSNGESLEMVTKQLPSNEKFDITFEKTLQTTLNNRPEVAQAVKHIQSAYLRLARSENEMMPTLDLFFKTYVKGIDGDYDYGSSYSNQFSDGDPSYVAGLRFEIPLGNNSAKARNIRKKLEIRQLLHQLDVTVENVLMEAKVSYCELEKNYRSMVQAYQIMLSDEEEEKALLSRVDYLLANNEQYGDVLYRLMDASERVTDSEALFAKSELTYNYALYNLYRVMGVLVSENDIVIEEIESESGDSLPIMQISKQ